MSRKWYELPESMEKLAYLSDEELLDRYNYWANASSSFERAALHYWRSEWEYRRQRKITETIRRLTWAIFALTAVMAVFAVLLYAR